MSERSVRSELEALQASLRVKEAELARQETTTFASKRKELLEQAELLERELRAEQLALAPLSTEGAQLTATVNALLTRHQRAEHQNLSPLLLIVLLPAIGVASLSGTIWLIAEAQGEQSRWVEFGLVSFLSPLLFVNLWARLLFRGASVTSRRALVTLVVSLVGLVVYSLAALKRAQPEGLWELVAVTLSLVSVALGAIERVRSPSPSEVLKVARVTALFTGVVGTISCALAAVPGGGLPTFGAALAGSVGALLGVEWLFKRLFQRS